MANIKAQAIRAQTGIVSKTVVVGDINGITDEPQSPGLVRCREYTAGGGLSKPQAYRWQSALPRTPGMNVTAYLINHNWVIKDSDFDGALSAGTNPVIVQQPTEAKKRWVNQSDITTFVVHPTAPASVSIAIRELLVLRRRTLSFLNDAAELSQDLTAYFPSAGQHRYAGVFLLPDLTIEISASTAKSVLDPLTIAGDAQECLTGASFGVMPVWAVVLNGDDGIVENKHITNGLDLRQFINVPNALDFMTDNVSNPPTDAELDAIFGTPAAVGAGYTAYIDDAGAGSNFYQIVSDGTNWWIFTGTKAV